jgi:hypothetical protein
MNLGNSNLDFVPPDLEFVPPGLDFVPFGLDFLPFGLDFLPSFLRKENSSGPTELYEQ